MALYSGVLYICLVHAVLSLFINVMRISSYNCQSSKRTGGINLLCDVSVIISIQEHWLYPFDLPSPNDLHNDFMSFGTSSIDVSESIVLGRPHGSWWLSGIMKKTLSSSGETSEF